MSAGTTADNDLLAKLNLQQVEAVTLDWGPALIIAGAGSGKTTVLTKRITYLISELGQDPESVFAVTFTNKAAGEMKKRVEALVGFDLARRITIGTFHSICARILRREIEAYKTAEGWTWTGNFVIYDETDSLSLAKACITRLNLDDKVFVPKSVRHEISALKNDGFTAADYATRAKTYRELRISSIFSAYQADLARNNAFDFDDLIGVFTDLLKQNPTVLARQRRRFRHVLVDEFQDTNKAQYDLVTMLSSPNQEGDWKERSLMVVGDIDQSIYSWRKADFRIILGFQKDYQNCKLIKLEENYRSTSTILEIANSIIENNTERIDKVLRCNRGKGGKAQCFEAQDEIDESFYVVEEMKRLKASGRNFADNVILYRTNAQSRAIEEILVRNHIPYTMVGATKFYDRQEIKDVLAYLKLIYNGRDSISFNRAINQPKRGVGKTSLERLGSYASEHKISLLEAAMQVDRIRDLPAKAAGALKEFALLVRSWQIAAGTLSAMERADAASQPPPKPTTGVAALGALFAFSEANRAQAEQAAAAKLAAANGQTADDLAESSVDAQPSHKTISVCDLLMRVLRETRYLEKLAADSEKDDLAEGRIENLNELVVVAKEFDEIADEPDLDSFLTRISLVSDLDAVKLDQDAVKLMTVHSAKGLEFSVVFVMGLEEGLFPHIRSLDSPTAMEEERRLMYVAVTRAADLLYLTLARKRTIMGRSPGSQSNFSTSYTIPSQFLQEITPGLLSGYYPRTRSESSSSSSRAGYEEPEHDSSFEDGDSGQRNFGGRSVGFGGDRSSTPSNRNTNDGNRSNSFGPNTGYGGGYGDSSRSGGYNSGSPSRNAPANSGASRGAPNNAARPRAMRTGEVAGGAASSNDNIRVQIDARPPGAAAQFEHLVVGDVVEHARFGTGKVIQVIGEQDKEIYNVEFEQAGKRLLDPRFAKLVKAP
jgi:DNA helicase-2/ATP-dependent DNA helicase PcrA